LPIDSRQQWTHGRDDARRDIEIQQQSPESPGARAGVFEPAEQLCGCRWVPSAKLHRRRAFALESGRQSRTVIGLALMRDRPRDIGQRQSLQDQPVPSSMS